MNHPIRSCCHDFSRKKVDMTEIAWSHQRSKKSGNESPNGRNLDTKLGMIAQAIAHDTASGHTFCVMSATIFLMAGLGFQTVAWTDTSCSGYAKWCNSCGGARKVARKQGVTILVIWLKSGRMVETRLYLKGQGCTRLCSSCLQPKLSSAQRLVASNSWRGAGYFLQPSDLHQPSFKKTRKTKMAAANRT